MRQVVTELVRARYGQELYPLAIPASLVGRLFSEVLVDFTHDDDRLVLAGHHGEDGAVQLNPPGG
jgi:hypothetical protein